MTKTSNDEFLNNLFTATCYSRKSFFPSKFLVFFFFVFVFDVLPQLALVVILPDEVGAGIESWKNKNKTF